MFYFQREDEGKVFVSREGGTLKCLSPKKGAG